MVLTKSELSFQTYVILIVVDDNCSGTPRRQRLLILHILVHVPVLVTTAIVLAYLLPEKVFLASVIPDVRVKKRISATRGLGRLPRILSLVLARLQEKEIQWIFALLLVCQQPCPDVIIFVQEDEIGQGERIPGLTTQAPGALTSRTDQVSGVPNFGLHSLRLDRPEQMAHVRKLQDAPGHAAVRVAGVPGKIQERMFRGRSPRSANDLDPYRPRAIRRRPIRFDQ